MIQKAFFSQRHGYRPTQKAIQRESLDQETRNQLWNVLSSILNSDSFNFWSKLQIDKVVWGDFFKETIDTYPSNSACENAHMSYYMFFKTFFCDKAEWFRCFDFAEFIIEISDYDWDNSYGSNMYSHMRKICNMRSGGLISNINEILEHESSAYRYIQHGFSEITSQIEINELDQAIGECVTPEQKQLDRALSLLSDRKKPDYQNSVKESILAVESICCRISQKDKATLGEALKIVEKKSSLHPALKNAFDKLYGYTSDAKGIRHGGIDFTVVDFNLAKYMLVTCAAFVNYLKANMK